MKKIEINNIILHYEIINNKVTAFYKKSGEFSIRKFIFFGKKYTEELFDYVTAIPVNINDCEEEQLNTWLDVVMINYENI